MARNASAIDGYITTASDGDLGTVSDFLFDDTSCPVRWLVVDTRKCLSGRNVLLPTLVLEHLDAERKEFAVWLTMQQVKDSPDVDTERPVSRQMEASVYDYCGWRPYLGGGLYMDSYTATWAAIAPWAARCWCSRRWEPGSARSRPRGFRAMMKTLICAALNR